MTHHQDSTDGEDPPIEQPKLREGVIDVATDILHDMEAEPDPVIRAILDHGHGDVLIEGDDLSAQDVWDAARKRLGGDFADQKSGIVFEHASGKRIRYGRFIGDARDVSFISQQDNAPDDLGRGN